MQAKSDLIRKAVQIAGELIKKANPSEGVEEKEGRANLVTATDLACEKAIIDLIRSHFPDDEILSEETTSTLADPLAEQRLWVIDPIDGTNNFRHERNYSAVSIGYIEKGVIQMGAAYDPFRDELFYAERGKGTVLNDKKITVSQQADLTKATVASDNSYYHEGTRNNLELALRLPETPWMMMKGSAVLTMCEVAVGRIDLYYHTFVKPWDNAAAFLIAEEAGALVRGIDGEEITFMSPSVVMGNKQLVTQFLQGTR